MTALNSAENRLEGFEIGADEYLPKPFHLKEFIIRVRHVLGTPACRRESSARAARRSISTRCRWSAPSGDEDVPAGARQPRAEAAHRRRAARRESIRDSRPRLGRGSVPDAARRGQRHRPAAAGAGRRPGRADPIGARRRISVGRKRGRVSDVNLFGRALPATSLAVPPIWLMRQAGRYHAPYQAAAPAPQLRRAVPDAGAGGGGGAGPGPRFRLRRGDSVQRSAVPARGARLRPELRRRPAEARWIADARADRRRSGRSRTRSSRLRFQHDAMAATRARLPRRQGPASDSSADRGRCSCTPSRARTRARWQRAKSSLDALSRVCATR